MNSDDKIYRVMRKIVEERKLSTDGTKIQYNFNKRLTRFHSLAGLLPAKDECKILLKLESDGLIQLEIPVEEESRVFSYDEHEVSLEEVMYRMQMIDVIFQEGFNKEYIKRKRALKYDGIDLVANN